MARDIRNCKRLDHYIVVVDEDCDNPTHMDEDTAENLYSYMKHEKVLKMINDVYPGMSAQFQKILADLFETKLRKSFCIEELLEQAMEEMREMYEEK